MIRWIGLMSFGTALMACAVAASSLQAEKIRSLHPVGYLRLIEIVPACAKANAANYEACRVGAQMAESSTTQLSTHRFLNHWRLVSFGETPDPDGIEWTDRVLLPVLRYLYRFSRDEYSRAMLPETDQINLHSKNSFDSFEKIHHQHAAALQR